MKTFPILVSGLCLTLLCALGLKAGEPNGPPAQEGETLFSTFSLCAIDPVTEEVGVAVTTRVPFVGRAVPWVEAGVGGVATQSWTRVEYGKEGLAHMKNGLSPAQAMEKMMAPDARKQRRQVGMINMKGQTATFTGEECGAWAGSREGKNYCVQANIMVGPEVVDAVAMSFESTEGLGMPLAERMILAMEAGQAKGGDKRWGRQQSAAIKIANPNVSGRGNDHISLEIRVGEHVTPVAEMKRIYLKTQQRLGFRDFSVIQGDDVLELKKMLHALGYWRKDLQSFPAAPVWQVEDGLAERDPTAFEKKRREFRQQYRQFQAEFATYDETAVAAVDAFRKEKQLQFSGNPPGLVDARLVAALKQAYFAQKRQETR